MKSKRPSHDLIKSKATDDDDMIDGSKEAPNDDAISTTEPSSEVLKIQEASPDCGDTPTSAAAWNAMLYNLLLYKARWGDMNVPNNEEHEALYEWVSEQRSLYKLYQEEGATAGEQENEDSAGAGLTSDRISVLDAVGFAWNIRGDVFWQRHYDALVQYKNEHGDVKVPRLFCKNPKLGEWVTEQRRQLKAKMDGRPSMMTEERQQKLDELGFLWKVRERADWNDRYEQLLEYKKEHGHCIVPQHYAQNKALGKWVAKQREQFRFYHAGKHSFLTEERIDLLKSLGFVWRVKGKGKTVLPMDDDPIDMEDSNLSAVLKLPKEEEENSDEAGEPKKKKRKKKVPPKKKAAAAAAAAAVKEDSNADDDDGSDIEDEDEEAVEETSKNEDAKTAAEDSKPAAAVTSVGPVSSMNRMGLLASISDGIPGMNPSGLPTLPSLPADQQLLFAEQQHAVRASMLENFAVRANQQMEFAQQRAMANSQTMADIAAALARQSRFGNGFAGGGMGMFNMPGMSLPNMQGDDAEENLRNLNFRI